MNNNLYPLTGSVLGGTMHIVIPTGYRVVESGTIEPTDKMCKGGKSHLRFGGKPDWIAVHPMFWGDSIDEAILLIRPVTGPN